MTAILTLDIGGSKTDLTLWQSDCRMPRRLRSLTIPTDYPDEEALLAPLDTVCQGRQDIEAAVLAVAGPITSDDGCLHLTNNPCRIDPARLQAHLPEDCRLSALNDLEALAHSLDALTPEQLIRIQPGGCHPYSPRLAAAVGTGFGMAALLPGRHVVPTEAGHTTFAPQTAAQAELCRRIAAGLPTLTVEHLLSGDGLARIFQAVCPQPQPLSTAEVTRLAAADEPLSADARRAVTIFSEAVGTTLANMTLVFLAAGGVFLGGGVIAHLGELFDCDAFTRGFCRPGTLSAILADTPVYLITDPAAVSLGAAIYAEQRLLG